MKPSKRDDMRDFGQALRECAETMDPRAKAEVRARVMAGVGKPRGLLVTAPRRFAAALAVATALSGGVAYAANGALPGDFLYPVKRALENAVVAVLPEGDLERTVLVEIATRRAEEAAQLHSEGPAELSTDSLRELRDALERVAGPDKLTQDEETQIRENAGEQGGPVHETVDDVIGRSAGETGGSDPGDPAGGTQGNPDAGAGSTEPGTGGQDSGPGPGTSQGSSGSGSDSSPERVPGTGKDQ